MGCLATISQQNSQQNSGQSAEIQGHSGRVSSFRTHDGWRVSGVENAVEMSQIQLVKHEDFTCFCACIIRRNLGKRLFLVVFLEAVAN